jgi:hypothetical protein
MNHIIQRALGKHQRLKGLNEVVEAGLEGKKVS